MKKTELSDYLKKIGSRGGKARAANLTDEKRSAIAKKAAKARWKSAKKKS